MRGNWGLWEGADRNDRILRSAISGRRAPLLVRGESQGHQSVNCIQSATLVGTVRAKEETASSPQRSVTVTVML